MLPERDLKFAQGLIDQGMVHPLTPPSAAPESALPGESRRFGKYDLLVKVGHGTAGGVYKALDRELNRVVALKILEAVPTEQVVQRFAREAQVLAQLRHENIVAIYERLQDQGRYAIAMEFIEGGSLAGELSNRARPLKDLLRIVQKSAEGLQCAHENGIIHRDVKPANIVLDAKGRPKITDFGLAAFAKAETMLTAPGAWMGTPAYMSPEQARGSTRETDARSDIYALGVILYEILTGRLPFVAASAAGIVYRILGEYPDPPRKIDPRIPRSLDTLCMKAMEKEPSRRFSTAGALADDLGRFLRGEPIEATPPSIQHWLRVAVHRHKRAMIAAAMALAVVTGLGAFLIQRSQASRRETETGRLNREREARLHRVEEIGQEITAWDGSLLAPPDVVDMPSLIGKMASCQARLEAVRLEDPSLSRVSYHLGRALRRLGHPAEAARHLDEAARLDPSSPWPLLERGLLRLERWSQDYIWSEIPAAAFGAAQEGIPKASRPSAAIEDLQAASRSGLPGIDADFARMLAGFVDLDEAGLSREFEEFKRRWSRESDYCFRMADAAFFTGCLLLTKNQHSRAALRLLDRSIEIRRSSPEAYAIRAIAKSMRFFLKGLDPVEKAGSRREAEEDAGRAAAMNPEYFGGPLALGMIRSAMVLQGLQESWEEIRRTTPKDRWKERYIEMAKPVLAGRDEVLGLLGRAVELSPGNSAGPYYRARASFLYAQTAFHTGEEKLADELLHRALEDLETATRLLGRTGWLVEDMKCVIYHILGRPDLSVRARDEAIRLAVGAGLDPDEERRHLERLMKGLDRKSP